VIAALAGQGLSAKRCCRICGVAPSGYFRWRGLPPSAGELRRRWLRGLITQVHTASRATYGYRRVRAELVLGYGLQVSNKLVAKLMAQEQLKGLPSRRRRRNLVAAATAADLVARDFQRPAPDQLWMTDITEHPTREGKLYCCVVLDAHSRRVIGWSIDSSQTAALVTNALGMAIANRKPDRGTVLHSDHGSQFTSWVFCERVRAAGLLPSMGTVGNAYDNAVVEAFWGRLQTELLDRKKWQTRVELAGAIFEYLEVFHNRSRRHSALGMLTPIEYEQLHAQAAGVA
jgi:putative transposase